jgi:hypothetical protein
MTGRVLTEEGKLTFVDDGVISISTRSASDGPSASCRDKPSDGAGTAERPHGPSGLGYRRRCNFNRSSGPQQAAKCAAQPQAGISSNQR